MFYYSSDIPIVGQIVIGHLILEKEEENCLYVRVPEYNNIEGIIPKSNLPKKKRAFRKILAQMKRDKIIPCLVKSEPRKDSGGQLWPLDLTLRSIDREKKQIIINRFNNITRILKIIKFLSEETKVSFEDLALGLHKLYVTELEVDKLAEDSDKDEDETKNADNLTQAFTDMSELYQKVIGNHDFLIETVKSEYDLTDEQEQLIRKTMTDNTEVKKSDCNISFEFRVDDASDPVKVLQDTFINIFNKIPDINIQYRGAPNYVATVQDVLSDEVQENIAKLSQIFEEYLSNLDPKPKYYLNFSSDNSIVKEPVYTFSFPREVRMD